MVVEVEIKGDGKSRTLGCLPLNGRTSLQAEAAKELAEYGQGPLILNGLTKLSADAARELAAFKGGAVVGTKLYLDGLTSIEPEAALALAAFGEGRFISLAGLVQAVGRTAPLDAETATLLVRRAQRDQLSSESQWIGQSHGLDLSAVGELSVAAAAAIAAECPKHLAIDLGGLRVLSVTVAEQLSKCRGRLVLNGVSQITPDVAAALARKEGFVSLAGLETMSPDVARAIAGSKYILTRDFPRLAQVPPEAVRALIDGVQRNPRALGGTLLGLSGLRSLSPECASEIGNNGDVLIKLDGLEDLSVESAARLADYRGMLSIACPGGRITPAILTLMRLATERGRGRPAIRLYLKGIDTLTAEDVANLAATSPLLDLWIGGLRTLTPAAAQAVVADLARHSVYFHDLVIVPPEFAANRPADNAPGIRFNPGPLQGVLRTAKTLTREVAEAVVTLAAAGAEATLDGITAIESPDSAELAAILATSKARLVLPRLRRISPKTLTALIEKEGISLPPLETLEFIPEPDASSTDDFVVPERLKARQRP